MVSSSKPGISAIASAKKLSVHSRGPWRPDLSGTARSSLRDSGDPARGKHRSLSSKLLASMPGARVAFQRSASATAAVSAPKVASPDRRPQLHRRLNRTLARFCDVTRWDLVVGPLGFEPRTDGRQSATLAIRTLNSRSPRWMSATSDRRAEAPILGARSFTAYELSRHPLYQLCAERVARRASRISSNCRVPSAGSRRERSAGRAGVPDDREA